MMRPQTMMSTIAAYIGTTRAAWSRRRTERLIRRMPDELRKDIGWPDLDRSIRTRHR